MTTEDVPEPPELVAVTEAVESLPALLPFAAPRTPLLFQRHGEGIAGIGETLRLEFRGPDRMRQAAAQWRRISAAARISDPVLRPGSGLVAFGAFAFDDHSKRTSVLIIPRLIVGRRGGVSWVTRIGGADEPLVDTPLGPELPVRLRAGAMNENGYRATVERAVARIRAGRLRKVVLARDLVGRFPADGDLRRVLDSLAATYPATWTFAVDGFLGASPETLVRVEAQAVSARVLAGSIGRGDDPASDAAAASRLANSAKDLGEHGYALQSLLASLEPLARDVSTSPEPYTLELPNLFHLASDVEGRLVDGSSSLDLIAVLHPTAAVAGTPTPTALTLIRELERTDRGLYAGPVGWVDADGDGRWAVGLRSAEVAADGAIRAFAGAGIVRDSDPEKELVETGLKFRPVVDAFG